MIQGISTGLPEEYLTKSLENLSNLLRATTEQSLQLTEKLITAQVKGTLQGLLDPGLGNTIDTSA
jgi:hypothetical protein